MHGGAGCPRRPPGGDGDGNRVEVVVTVIVLLAICGAFVLTFLGMGR